MDDNTIHNQIDALAIEEHDLFKKESDGKATPADACAAGRAKAVTWLAKLAHFRGRHFGRSSRSRLLLANDALVLRLPINVGQHAASESEQN